MGKQWTISIQPPFGGFAPAYWEESFSAYGNKNMAGSMTDISIISPDKMTQGAGLSTLTNGTQDGAVTTLLKHILDTPPTSNVTYGTGGARVYKISSTTVQDDASDTPFPHLIDKGTVTGEDGKSVVYYNGYLYYFYNHSGSAGDIGRLTVATDTFDDDWGSTIPTGMSALANAPHPAILGGDGIIYFGNGRYVGFYDPLTNTLSADELDLPIDCQVEDLVWEKTVLWIVTNRGILYVWDTVSASFQEPVIEINGKFGALFVKNGRIFVFYQDLSSVGGFKLGYVVGDTIQELQGFTGTLPQFGQVTYYKNMIAFLSNGQIFLWGATSNKIPVALSQFMDGGYATCGALAKPFGTLMVASNETTSYKLAKESGYSILSAWNTMMFDVTHSMVDEVIVYYYPTDTGSRCDLTLRYNRGVSTLALTKAGQTGSITHTNDSGQNKKTFYPKQEVSDFRLELSWANGSATNPLAIKKIDIIGHSVFKV